MKKTRMVKKVLAILLATALLTGFTACGGDSGQGSGSGSTSELPGKGIKIGLVLSTGGLGDKNMNDMAYEGLQQCQKELGIEFDYTTPSSPSEYETAHRLYAESGEYDLIIAIAAPQKDGLIKVAKEFPDQKFTWFDGDVNETNIRALRTLWPQQTFLCGVIAGLAVKSDMPNINKTKQVVGCVLAQEQPQLVEGTVGFEAGVKYANPDCEVLHAVVGDFNDPGKAKEIALSMYSKGASFIQHIAGASGLGVFNAAVEAGRYAFGVGSNQNDIEPDVIAATSLKDVKAITINGVKDLIAGKWSGGLVEIGMKDGGTGYTTEGSNVKIPDDILKKVEEIKKLIVDGKLTPPAKKEDLAQWLKDNKLS